MSVKNLRVRTWALSLLLLVAFSIVPLALAQDDATPRTGFRPDAPSYGIRGPHTVGYMTFSWNGSDAPLDGAIWYPADNPDGVDESVTYQLVNNAAFPDFMNYFDGRAIADAPPDAKEGPYPLIISSTGYGGSPNHLASLHEHLASYGFVVIAPWHQGNGLRDSFVQTPEAIKAFELTSIESMIRRPQEVSRSIDYAEMLTTTDGTFAGVIDLDHVGVMGMSYGGYTVIVSLGARLDFREAAAFCASGNAVRDVSQIVCKNYADDLAGLESHLIEISGLDMDPGALWSSLGDPRIDAGFAIVPGGGMSFISPEGYAAVTKPLFIMNGSLDMGEIIEQTNAQAWEYVASENKSSVTVENAGHTFALRCGAGLQVGFFQMCNDAVWDKDRVSDLTDHFLAAFMLSQLYDDAEAAAALTPDAVQFPGITYHTTGF